MCGIVGLLILDRDLEPQLGELLAAMLVQMTERGPGLGGCCRLLGRAAGGPLQVLVPHRRRRRLGLAGR